MKYESPQIKAIGDSFNKFMEAIGSTERLKEFTQETTNHNKYSKSFSITRYSHKDGIVDVDILHDGFPIFLANVSRDDADSLSAIFADLASGEL